MQNGCKSTVEMNKGFGRIILQAFLFITSLHSHFYMRFLAIITKSVVINVIFLLHFVYRTMDHKYWSNYY